MIKIIPPVYLLATILSMMALHFMWPGFIFACLKAFVFGVILIIFGGALILWSVKIFNRAGTAIRPFEPVTALVNTGPYKFSRNPIYLGMISILLGVAICLGSITPFLLIPFFVFVIRQKFIIAEEAMLLEKFGDGYVSYQKRVRRWL